MKLCHLQLTMELMALIVEGADGVWNPLNQAENKVAIGDISPDKDPSAQAV